MKNKKKDKKCKACLGLFYNIDLRGLCTHCAFKIDTIDSKACDINEIREEMRSLGIPTGNGQPHEYFGFQIDDDYEDDSGFTDMSVLHEVDIYEQ